jgi:hypothetical protein
VQSTAAQLTRPRLPDQLTGGHFLTLGPTGFQPVTTPKPFREEAGRVPARPGFTFTISGGHPGNVGDPLAPFFSEGTLDVLSLRHLSLVVFPICEFV